ncbi:MAG TPA: hypothetical protein VJA21_12565 [Verrucomicrobiae bacterium]
MKTMKFFCLTWLVLTGGLSGARGEQFRTDINPGLLYYQGFLLTPDLDAGERDFLWNTNSWMGQKLPEQAGQLLGRYDAQFGFVRRAAKSTVPCDWGIDLSAGPATLLPQLARDKAVVQTARLRVMWDLQQGKAEEARDDWLAAFSLARNISSDGTVISMLVQLATEAIEYNTLAENFGKFPPEVLKQLLDGIDAAPAGGTVAGAISKEKTVFLDWTLGKIQELRKQNPGDDAKVMEGIRQLVTHGEESENLTDLWSQISRAAGGTSEGVIELLKGREAAYAELAPLLALPYAESKQRIGQVTSELEKSPNPFAKTSIPSFLRARAREFRIQVSRAMVRAAIEYTLHGQAGLEKVTDPCGQGPFGFERFVFEGKDRGFLLRSAYEDNGKPEVLIFVEKEGPPFRLNGPRAGEAYVVKPIETGQPDSSAMDAFRRRYGLTPSK